MRKILILVAVLFLLGGCSMEEFERAEWVRNFGKDFQYRITICCQDTDFLVKEFKIVKNAKKTHLAMRDGLMRAGGSRNQGVEFSRFVVVVTPAKIVHIRKISKN